MPPLAILRFLCQSWVVSLSLLAFDSRALGRAEEEGVINCYYFDGRISPNNTRCPDSNTCCPPNRECLSNRLCRDPADGENNWIRGPCAVKGWDGACAQICLYDEPGGRFPRVTECADGSLCCSNEPWCCQDKKGVFLDQNGNIIATRATAPTTTYVVVGTGLSRSPLPPAPEASASSTLNSADTAQTTPVTNNDDERPTATDSSAALDSSLPPSSPTSSVTSPESSESDSTLGLRLGLGLGIPLAVLVTACIAYFGMRLLGWRRSTDAAPHERGDADVASSSYYMYGSPPPKEPVPLMRYPVELMGHEAGELDGQPRGELCLRLCGLQLAH
ncbi:hypothetical protein VTJ49DRAFT_1108 [Mycothermus thermophilus]|uniref:Mid2 domain-containing protein n=1 Tax=Humicola insolens TaxID=85995 RepID=A0ABR3VNX8_HUMIN